MLVANALLKHLLKSSDTEVSKAVGSVANSHPRGPLPFQNSFTSSACRSQYRKGRGQPRGWTSLCIHLRRLQMAVSSQVSLPCMALTQNTQLPGHSMTTPTKHVEPHPGDNAGHVHPREQDLQASFGNMRTRNSATDSCRRKSGAPSPWPRGSHS